MFEVRPSPVSTKNTIQTPQAHIESGASGLLGQFRCPRRWWWERLIFRHGWEPNVRHDAIVITGIGAGQRIVADDMRVNDLA